MKFDTITEDSIRQMVYGFYDDVRTDAVLGPVFEQVLHDKWDEHMPRMVNFWATILLGVPRFSGNVFGKHMALSGIAPEHFTRWLSLFKKTVMRLYEEDTAAEILEIADSIAGSLQLGYFGERPVSVAAV